MSINPLNSNQIASLLSSSTTSQDKTSANSSGLFDSKTESSWDAWDNYIEELKENFKTTNNAKTQSTTSATSSTTSSEASTASDQNTSGESWDSYIENLKKEVAERNKNNVNQGQSWDDYIAALKSKYSFTMGKSNVPEANYSKTKYDEGYNEEETTAASSNTSKMYTRIWGDPHIVAADGSKYDFQGTTGQNYNLLSDNNLELNAKFGKYTKEGTNIISQTGLTVKGSSDDDISLVSFGSDGSATINGEAMKEGSTQTLADGGTAVLKDGKLTITTAEGYTVVQTTAESSGVSYVNVDVESGSKGVNSDGVNPDGILGNTFLGDNTINESEIEESSLFSSNAKSSLISSLSKSLSSSVNSFADIMAKLSSILGG